MSTTTTFRSLVTAGLMLTFAACGSDESTSPNEAAVTDNTPEDSISAEATADANTDSNPDATTVITCDRSCLEGFVDEYLAALVANDPEQAPFAEDARFTENAQVLELGDALWGTASAGPDDYQLIVSDPENNTAGFWVMMEEAGEPIWLTGRLTVANNAITELETVIVRSDAGLAGFDLESPDPMWSETVPPESRNNREELFAAADGYLDTLQDNLQDHVQFSEDCDRIENGVYTANHPEATEGLGASSCQENVDSGMWAYITEIAPRRHLIADEERGIAMGVYMFHHNGQHDHAMVNGERVEYEGATRRPFTTVIPEMFKVQDGRIHRVMASMVSIPYRSGSGWEQE